MRTIGFLAVCVGVLFASGSDAQPASAPQKSCFYMRDMRGWKAPDAKTIYVRVGMSDFYRLDLSASCSMLMQPGVHLVTKTRGNDSVCDALDWDLSVSSNVGGMARGPVQGCIVKMMTPLSAADVAAIPKKFRP